MHDAIDNLDGRRVARPGAQDYLWREDRRRREQLHVGALLPPPEELLAGGQEVPLERQHRQTAVEGRLGELRDDAIGRLGATGRALGVAALGGRAARARQRRRGRRRDHARAGRRELAHELGELLAADECRGAHLMNSSWSSWRKAPMGEAIPGSSLTT